MTERSLSLGRCGRHWGGSSYPKSPNAPGLLTGRHYSTGGNVFLVQGRQENKT